VNGGLEGRRSHQVDDPADPGRTIVDIDRIEGGTLWEEKTATNAFDRHRGTDDVPQWIARHVTRKFAAYLEARQHVPGYEQAPVGFDFVTPGVDPAFKAAVETEVARLRAAHPGVTIYTKWRD
jgi:hypothetical protein